MMVFNYQVTVEEFDGPSVLKGSFNMDEGERRVVCNLPSGHLRSVTATTPLHLADGEKIFMNGYQTWTYCPEYTPRDMQRDHAPLPDSAVNKFQLDRYAD
ncbi:MAG: hypothetical protein SPK76_02865, partial [Bacteroidales bacterium]|nr:hypothetical protein [Bacteroidales bacterium]